MRRRLLMTVLTLLTVPLTTPAEEGPEPEFQHPCEGEVWWADTGANRSDFDFWVGEWQVFDRESGTLVGFDDIRKVYGGCALRQHWRHMNDRFTLPGASWRMQGGSETALAADGRWHQVWIDNNGGYIHVAGGLDGEGVMVLQSDWIEYTDRAGNSQKLRYRWHWAPKDDGTIHNWGLRQRATSELSEWTTVFDIVYRPNAPGGPTAHFNR